MLVEDENQPDPIQPAPAQAITSNEIFADARNLQTKALELLQNGNSREAAGLSWGATKRATEALILSRTGLEPITRSQTSDWLEALSSSDPAVETLVRQYYSSLSQLHYDCFHDGACTPEDHERIRKISDYIRDAERLSGD